MAFLGVLAGGLIAGFVAVYNARRADVAATASRDAVERQAQLGREAALQQLKISTAAADALAEANAERGRLHEHEQWRRNERAKVYVQTLDWVWTQNMWQQSVAKAAGKEPIHQTTFDQSDWGFRNASLQAVGSDDVVDAFTRILDQFNEMQLYAEVVREGPDPSDGGWHPDASKAAKKIQELSPQINDTGSESTLR